MASEKSIDILKQYPPTALSLSWQLHDDVLSAPLSSAVPEAASSVQHRGLLTAEGHRAQSVLTRGEGQGM